MFRRLLQPGSEAEDILFGHAVVADRDDLRAPVGSVPVLSRISVRMRAIVSCGPVPLMSAEMRRPRQAGHQRDRYGQYQRTGGRHDQYGDGPGRIAREHQAVKAIATVTARKPSDQRSASRDIVALDRCASSTSRTIPA